MKYIKIKSKERENKNRQKYKNTVNRHIYTNTQVNSCCTHTKHTQKQAQLINDNSCSNNQVLHINAALIEVLAATP